MNAVSTISTGFEQSLSTNKDTQIAGNKNNINAPGIQFQDVLCALLHYAACALLHYAAFTLVKKSYAAFSYNSTILTTDNVTIRIKL